MRTADIKVGDRFGKLVVLELAPKKRGYRRWLCHCNCGVERAFTASALVSNGVKSCGCARYDCKVVNPGDKFGKLTAIRYTRRGGCARAPYFLFKCDCGQEKELNAYRVAGGLTKSCGCLQRLAVAKMARQRRLPNSEGAVRVLFTRYKLRARERGFEFQVSYENFKELANRPCAYCGKLRPLSVSKFHRNVMLSGLDRLDSAVGYLPQNVVSCCSICNTAKNSMSVEVFVVWAREVVFHLKDF